MRQTATLEGVPGLVDLRFSFRSGLEGEWQGTFFFGADHGPALDRVRSDRRAILETKLEEERRILPVTITSLADDGLAFFRSDERSLPTDRPTAHAGARTPVGHDTCPPQDHGRQVHTSADRWGDPLGLYD